MSHKPLSDDVLLSMLNGTDDDQKKALEALYKDPSLRKKILAFVWQNGGSAEDGKEVLHETVIIFYKNIRNGKYRGEGTLRDYFYGIAKMYWFAAKRVATKVIKEAVEDTVNEKANNVFDHMILEEKKTALNLVIMQLGERCQKILTLWGYNESMEKIAEAMGFRDKNAAKKEAYRCRERVRKYIEEHPELKELLDF